MSAQIEATEAAVKLAAEYELDLADINGSGTDGRITKGDVEVAVAALEEVDRGDAESAEAEVEAAPDVETAVTPEAEPEPKTGIEAAVGVGAQTQVESEPEPEPPTFAEQVAAAETLEALIALGGQAAGEAERTAVRERAKELLKK